MNKSQQHWWPVLKRLLYYAQSWKRYLLIAIGMLWITVIIEVSGPLLITYFIDHLVSQHQIPGTLFKCLIGVVITLQLLAAVLHYWQVFLFNIVSINVIKKLRIDLMKVALSQPMNIFDEKPIGQIISRITDDTEVIKNLYVTVIATVLRSTILIVTMIVAMLILDWRMALLAMLLFPMVLLVIIIYQYYSTPITRKIKNYLADINNSFNEAIIGMTVIQQFRQQERFRKRINEISRLHYLARMQTLRLDGWLLRPLLNLLSSVILCGLLIFFNLYINNILKIGILYAFITYLSRLNEPLVQFAAQQSVIQQAVVSGERVFELMDSIKQKYGYDNKPLSSGSIILEKLHFSYNKDHNILVDINLSIPSCSFMAIVGYTGSGKSTIANLLMGYYSSNHGEIYLDNRPIKQLTRRVLRKGIAMVQQEPVILADSLLENISLGRNIKEQVIWDVLEKVKLIDLVNSMPNGIYTKLEEQGSNLSAGQKQLLSLARVLVELPKIIILDEATANIDIGTEQAIQQTLDELRHNTTLVVIAHRLSTIIKADNIVVLYKGKVLEKGNHNKLILNKGHYWNMYQLHKSQKDFIRNDFSSK
ncbi:multidrug ABC transporter permease/ATP-binding protein [Candidatus Pantoea edessiphila]|uniref:Multidrug resistance-like ATP-binding protein MdlB n=1 Tax=Candidatus Pantoea edessiphila TaxID=2044610 RepID=A0A2P5SXI5_9GAMM|nr:SmdB family multidrug efflux ABC transporter permease/ATP-binding protein [Candidatus Pantoea edessiphila]MBK4775806.1 SmdB family multidrug efflux ABC transporter permease/ATP-binding protein [Pantoea sp. Edef]PPI87012.1 multidrug ABC transporter permease/ATP-binding protein [Candidatus Pantoea edessiphila]